MSSNGPRASLRLLVALLVAAVRVFRSVLAANRAEAEADHAEAEARLAKQGAQAALERAKTAALAADLASLDAASIRENAAVASAVAEGRLNGVLDAAE